MISTYQSNHLKKDKKIQWGSYYTPKSLVDVVYDNVNPYLEKNKASALIFDSAAGCGAFVIGLNGFSYRVADWDREAYNFLKKHLKSENIFLGNSLKNVSRNKYNIPENLFLVMVGNPPYNDTTSKYKNGKKGENISDNDLFDRDLGISFLKSYNKLRADVVCVLHPLAYLIKESNFKRLKGFKDNYKLVNGVIFPSSIFPGTGANKFPIIVGLYERDEGGMSFDYIKSFKFSLLDSRKKFKLSDHETTDGFINKYPPRKKDPKKSSIGLYYYTFRDINSLKRNASFMDKPHYNGIVVAIENFYKYAYLYAFKCLFEPEDRWLYGNLSPLVNKEKLENNQKKYVEYALQTNPGLKKLNKSILRKIATYYKVDLGKPTSIEKLKKDIGRELNSLA